jgi:hypothetical protein
MSDPIFPSWFVEEAFSEYNRWCGDSWVRAATRGSGSSINSSPVSCAAACTLLGLEVLLAGDRVKLTRSAGRILQLAEEAIVVGVYQG